MFHDSQTTVRQSHLRGFTLVELSIVLVIIGLIVGAVVGGKSLIHAAELRGVVTDVQNIKSAWSAFQLQYDELPGDMPNAADYWSTAVNGNGDNWIGAPKGFWGGSTYWFELVANAIAGEGYTTWSHLSFAGMTFGGSGLNVVIGDGIPESPVSGVGYWISSGRVYGEDREAHYLSMAGDIAADRAFTPEDAKALDTKMDDGRADRGEVLGGNGTGAIGTCMPAIEFGTNPSRPRDYILSTAGKTCVLRIRLGWQY